MANIALTSIGVKVSYCAGETRPTSGYTVIEGLRSTPDFNQTPNTADATTFANTTYTTKVELLRELPDALEFGAILGNEFVTAWETLCSAYDTAIAANKEIWFCIDIPGLSKSMFFTGKPVTMGLPAMEANTVIEHTVYIVPTGEPELVSDPTNTKENKYLTASSV